MGINTDNSGFTQEELNVIKTIKFKDVKDKSLPSEHEELINRYLKKQLDISKIVSPVLELQKQMVSYSNTIKNHIDKSISQVQPVIASITNSMLSYMNTLNEILKDFDFNKFYLRLISELLSEKQECCEKFLDESIFPPIFYIALDDNLDNSNINVNEYIKQEGLKQYYSDRIRDWHNEDIEGYPNELIDDIKFNYDNNRVYGVVTLIFVLLEYRVRNVKVGKGVPKRNGRITKSIRDNLKENVFNPTDSKFLYDEFIDTEGDSYIYKSTDKNPNSITRHVLHGDKLELITYESMMSVVFLYDFINEVLSYKNS